MAQGRTHGLINRKLYVSVSVFGAHRKQATETKTYIVDDNHNFDYKQFYFLNIEGKNNVNKNYCHYDLLLF